VTTTHSLFQFAQGLSEKTLRSNAIVTCAGSSPRDPAETGIESVGSRTNWGFQGFYFSDYTMDVLVFNYNNSKVMLGKELENFDARELEIAVK